MMMVMVMSIATTMMMITIIIDLSPHDDDLWRTNKSMLMSCLALPFQLFLMGGSISFKNLITPPVQTNRINYNRCFSYNNYKFLPPLVDYYPSHSPSIHDKDFTIQTWCAIVVTRIIGLLIVLLSLLDVALNLF